MQVDIDWYWNQKPQQHVITVTTRTILHPRIEVNALTYFHSIPTIVCTSTQAKEAISWQPICLTDSDYDYIYGEIGCWEKIEFKRDVEVYSADEEK